MKPMNYLEQLAYEILQSGGKTVDWLIIRNSYFRSGTATDSWKACELWASQNGIIASPEYKVETATGGIIQSVFFQPIHPQTK
jgi:hypothetical protein